ncbi:MAG: hypothetical protein ACKVT1_04315 [Dehalococcoidia bacterium]
MPGTVKDELRALTERLPDDATWDDVLYEIYVAAKISAGLADAASGRTMSIQALKRELGLTG